MNILGFSPEIIRKRLEESSPKFAQLPEERKQWAIHYMIAHPNRALKAIKKLAKTENEATAMNWLAYGKMPKQDKELEKSETLEPDDIPTTIIGELLTAPIALPEEITKRIALHGLKKGLAKYGLHQGLKALTAFLGMESSKMAGETLTESGYPLAGLIVSYGGYAIPIPTMHGIEKGLLRLSDNAKLSAEFAKAITKKSSRKGIKKAFDFLLNTAKSFKLAHAIRKGSKDIGEFQKLFGNMEYLSTKFPELKPIYERELSRMMGRHEDAFRLLYANGKGVVDKWGKSLIDNLDTNERKILNDLLTISDRYPRFNEIIHEKGIGKIAKISDEQLKAWNVPNKVIDAYNKIRRVSSKAQHYLITFIAKHHNDIGLSKKDAISLVKRIISNPGYYPRMRFDKGYWITAIHEPTGKVIWKTPAKAWELENKKADVFNILTKQFGKPTDRPVGRTLHSLIKPEDIKIEVSKALQFPEGMPFERAIATNNIGGIIQSLQEQGKLPPDAAQAFLDELNKVFLARGFGRHFLHRAPHWIGGFEENPILTLGNFVRGLTGYTHKVMAAKDMAKELNKIASLSKPELAKYAQGYVTRVLSNTTKADKAFAGLRQLAYAYHLAGKPAFAVINATQNIITAKPLLDAFAKKAGLSSPGLSRAMKDMAKIMIRHSARSLPREEQEALLRAIHSGVVSNPFVEEMLAADTGATRASRRIWETISKPISWSEILNRGSTFLSAYRVARKAGMDSESAWKAAADIVRKAHFQYGKANLPPWAATPIGKTWLTLRQYTLHLLNLWRELLGKGEYKALLKSIGMVGTLGGVSSYPFVKMIKHHLRREYGIDVDKELREKGVPPKALEAINQGLPAAILGTNLGTSLTMDIPFSNIESAADALREVASPGGVALWRIAEGMANFLHAKTPGEKTKALELILPAFIRNPIKAIDVYNRGITSRSGIPVWMRSSKGFYPYKYGKYDAALRALSFMPESETILYENMRHYADMDRFSSAWRRKIYTMLRSGMLSNGILEIGKYNQWAKDNGFSPIDVSKIKQALAQMGFKKAELQYQYPY